MRTLEAASERPGRLRQLYRRFEKHVPIATFVAGFVWDSLTLTRIDRLLDNLILLGYLAVLGATIVLILTRQAGRLRTRPILKLEPHFLWITQFLLGALLSSYVVFYFKSVSWGQTQLFFIVLLALFIGNEFLRHRLANPVLLATLFFFCLFSFFAFFLPVIFASLSVWMFLLAGALSLAASFLVLAVAYPPAGWPGLKPVAAGIVATYAALNVCYFANLIPPVPLALKSAGIYHSVVKTSGGYEVAYVPRTSWVFWRESDDPFYLTAGESAYCYTAIFAPRRIQIPVKHVWSRYQPGEGWTHTDTISFEISGGREGGYRGFTRKRSMSVGKWRVEVRTDRGQLLGRVQFEVAPSPVPHPSLVTRLIE